MPEVGTPRILPSEHHLFVQCKWLFLAQSGHQDQARECPH